MGGGEAAEEKRTRRRWGSEEETERQWLDRRSDAIALSGAVSSSDGLRLREHYFRRNNGSLLLPIAA